MGTNYDRNWREKIISYQAVPDFLLTTAPGKSVVMASCPADILHNGHIQYLEASAKLGDVLVVICNGSGFLKRKKGYEAISALERATMIALCPFVDVVTIYNSEVQDVSDCIRTICPQAFVNGGDRADDSTAPIEEIRATEEVGCRRIYGVGGTHKVNSSSSIAKLIMRQRPLSEIHEMADKISHSLGCDRHDYDLIMTHPSGV